jgi:hypothetical protein
MGTIGYDTILGTTYKHKKNNSENIIPITANHFGRIIGSGFFNLMNDGFHFKVKNIMKPVSITVIKYDTGLGL